MSAFTRAREKLPPQPEKVISVPPSAFETSWRERPTEPVLVGLRAPADYDVACARTEAARTAKDLYPRPDDRALYEAEYQNALLREACALCMCQPNDVRLPYFGNPEDDVRTKLTTDGVRFIVDEFEKYTVETSPVHRAADDDEVAQLVDMLEHIGIPEDMPADKAARVRRYIAYVLDELFDAL